MAGTWDELVQKIKDRLDIVEVVSEQVVLKKQGNRYWGLCPFHKDKKPSFCVTPHLGMYKCFSCGAAGDALKFIMETRNIEFKDLILELAEKYGFEVPTSHHNNNGTSIKEVKEQMMTATMVAAEFYHDLLLREKSPNAEIALKYLTKRGIGTDIIKKFHLGIAPKNYTTLYDELRKDFSNEILEKAGLILKSDKGGYIDRFRNRVIIPIQNENGDFVAFGARALEEGQNPKYLNSSDSLIYNKSRLLYGLYTAKDAIKADDAVILMEGYFDVISSQAHGIENCVASCGTSLTTDHVKLLSRYTKSRRIYLSFDTDSAGQKATARGAQIIRDVFKGLGDIKQFDESYVSSDKDKYACEIRVIAPPEGKDPDEFVRSVGADAYKMYMESAPLFIDFQLQNILKEKEKYTTPQEKAQYIKQIIPILAEIENRIIRSEYIDMVAQALGIDPQAINTEIRVFERANIPQAERIIKNVTKKRSVMQKAQKNLLSVFLVADSPLTFTQINEMINGVEFEDEILINVKSTIDKLICTVNNVKELIEHLYTEFVDKPELQAVLPELIATAEVYKGLSEEDFESVIKETIEKINHCRQVKETEHIKSLYKGISDDSPEALKFQIQLRDKIKKNRQKSEKF